MQNVELGDECEGCDVVLNRAVDVALDLVDVEVVGFIESRSLDAALAVAATEIDGADGVHRVGVEARAVAKGAVAVDGLGTDEHDVEVGAVLERPAPTDLEVANRQVEAQAAPHRIE